MAHQTQTPMDQQYSTNRISQSLLEEIAQALKNVSPFGSVEIYVQDNVVTQITIRNIKKTTTQHKQKISGNPPEKAKVLSGNY